MQLFSEPFKPFSVTTARGFTLSQTHWMIQNFCDPEWSKPGSSRPFHLLPVTWWLLSPPVRDPQHELYWEPSSCVAVSSLAGHLQPAFTNAPGITAVPFCVFMFKVRAELHPLCSLDGRFSRLPSDTSHRYTWHSCLCCDWWSIEGQRRNPQQTWTASHVWIFFFTKDQRAVGQEGASPDLFERQNNCSVCIERCL